MFAKTGTLFALLAVATRVLATPPACLIAAVNTQPNPAALSAVCSGNNATMVESYICKNCTADNVQLAMSGFASVCAGAGVTIKNTTSCSATSSSSSSGTASMTSSGMSLATGSSGAILTGASSGFATATANGTVSSAHSAPTATQSSTGGSGSGTNSGSGSNGASGTSSGSSASASAKPYTGAAARLGMDLVGLAALGAFGAMLAL